MLPFNYHHLYYFYTIAKSGSVSRAAKELRLSQPALSAQLKHLENHLDVKLFERQGRKLVLTEEGHTALSYANQIFDAGKEFADSLRDRSQKGRLRVQIGVLDSIPKVFVNALLKFILAEDPSVHIQLHEDTLERMMEDLKDHSLDLILADRPVNVSSEEKIENDLIAKIPVVFCAHPKLAKKYRKIPRDLQDAPLIYPTADSRVFHSVQEYLAGQKITPKVVAEIQDIELARLMAMEGLGIVPLSRLMVSSTEKRQLVMLDLASKPIIHESIYIISKQRNRPHPLLLALLKKFHFKHIP